MKRARGKCLIRNGKIFIRESGFCEQVLLHEYMHRLSRNFKHIGFMKRYWIEGIMYPDKKVAYCGMIEVFAEWLTFNITNISEDTAYTTLFIEDMKEKS